MVTVYKCKDAGRDPDISPYIYSPGHVPRTFPLLDNSPPFSHGVGHSLFTTTTMPHYIKRSTVSVYKIDSR